MVVFLELSPAQWLLSYNGDSCVLSKQWSCSCKLGPGDNSPQPRKFHLSDTSFVTSRPGDKSPRLDQWEPEPVSVAQWEAARREPRESPVCRVVAGGGGARASDLDSTLETAVGPPSHQHSCEASHGREHCI